MDLIIFVIALSILVLVHEFGHYLAAIKSGIKVEEFGLGLPPKLIGKRFGETLFSLNLLPIGGFCKLYGEDRGGKGDRAFNNKKPILKLAVVLGGVLMNLVLAVAIFSVVYAILGIPVEGDKVKVIGVAPESPAQEAGLAEDDWIVSIEGSQIKQPAELTQIVSEHKGENVDLVIETSKGERKELEILVRETPPEGEGGMGVAISDVEMVKVPWWQFYKGIGAGFKEAYFWGKIIAEGIGKMVTTLLSGQVPSDVSGPVGMYQATSKIKQNQGMLAVIHFFGIVSVNLAIVNILPFPALDGGRIIFVLYEMIFKKKPKEEFEAAVNNIGMLLLLFLFLLITAGDIRRAIGR